MIVPFLSIFLKSRFVKESKLKEKIKRQPLTIQNVQEDIYGRAENENVGGRIRLLKKDDDQLMNNIMKRENDARIRMMKKDMSGKIRLLKRDMSGRIRLLKRDLDGRIRMLK